VRGSPAGPGSSAVLKQCAPARLSGADMALLAAAGLVEDALAFERRDPS